MNPTRFSVFAGFAPEDTPVTNSFHHLFSGRMANSEHIFYEG